MKEQSENGESLEVRIILGALAGLCILIAGAAADISVRTAVEVDRLQRTATSGR